ncbi:uncharacterized protein LOC115443980 [Manduca sexta]|uniref:uncharacterized protein LOC115443980 n=1 Tax=Manduca sexta TaxID=7130 RepID=UPI00188E89FD|nr:uncharacterized protein LOC115443980 [Manduca sexta]
MNYQKNMKKHTDTRNKKCEYVSKDILEEDFVKSFKLLIYIQMALGSCRVYNKDRFLTSPTIFQKIYTILCIIITITLYAVILNDYSWKYGKTSYLYYLITAVFLVDLITYICNMIQVRFLNSDANIEFFIHLQNMDRLMKIEHKGTIWTTLRKINNVSLIYFVVGLFGYLFYAIYKGGLINWSYSSLVNSQLTLMLEIGNCSNFVAHFIIRLNIVNCIMCNHLNPNKSKKRPKIYLTVTALKRWIRYTTAKTHDFALNDTENYLKAIFDGFKKFREIYKFQVCVFCFKIVILSLITFEFVLTGVQNNLLKLAEIITVVMFSVINYLVALVLSVRYELFYREVKRTKRLSISMLRQYQEGPLREKAKRMLKMIEESPPSFSVYDMWYMDASIFLKMINLVTTLIVTLLQFAFL